MCQIRKCLLVAGVEWGGAVGVLADGGEGCDGAGGGVGDGGEDRDLADVVAVEELDAEGVEQGLLVGEGGVVA